MGDSFTHEFSVGGVNTGRSTPDQQMTVPSTFDVNGNPVGSQKVTNPGVPIMRPSFLQAFLANLGPALAGGLAAEPGHPFGTGLGGAMGGIQAQNQRNREYALQTQAAQREQAMAASSMAAQAAQTARTTALTPIELEQGRIAVQQGLLGLQRTQGILGLLNQPGGMDKIFDPMIGSLGDLKPDEQAQINAAKQTALTSSMSKGALDTAPVNAAVSKIAQDRLAKNTPEQQEMNDWMKKNPGKGPADFMAYKAKLVPQFNFNLQAAGAPGGPTPAGPGGQPLQGDALINSFGNKSGVVKAIIEGRQAPPKSFAQKSPYWQDVMAKVYQVDPQFNEQRAELRQSYTVGQHSKEINAINTAMGHVGVLSDSIDALNNNNIQVLNRIANTLGAQVGQTPQTTFKTIVNRVAPELTKAYAGTGGGVGERESAGADFSPSMSPAQLKANVGITAQLLRSKISALENQWDQNKAPGMPNFQDRFIMPAAKQALDKLAPGGEGGGGVTVTAPDGSVHTFRDQASADNFKRLAGIK